jgi:hypothetical protein
LRIFSRARGKAGAAQGQLPSGAAPAGLLPSGETALEPAMFRQQIAQALKHNPEQVRQMFLSWMEEKE